MHAGIDRFWSQLNERINRIAASRAGQMAQAAGFEIEHNGGGCLAFRRPHMASAAYVLITITDCDCEGEPEEVEWIVGLHDDEGRYGEAYCGLTLPEALIGADLLPPLLP